VTRIKLLLCLKDVEIRLIAYFNSMLIEYTLKYTLLKTELLCIIFEGEFFLKGKC